MKQDNRRLVQRADENGGYYLDKMTDEEHETFEAELQRPDFMWAHGLDPENFERTWMRQSGLCGTCVRPLDITNAFFEQDGGAFIVCANDSAILHIRADAEQFNIQSPV